MNGHQVLGCRSAALIAALGALLGIVSCGRPSVPTKLAIMGGKPAEPSVYPAVALLRLDGAGVWYVFCSGVMLSQQHVLTAAHCSTAAAADLDSVRIVANTARPEAQPEQQLRVKAITVSPTFQESKMARDADDVLRPSDASDVAVWLLAEAAVGAQVASIAQPELLGQIFQDGQILVLAGFGQSSSWESPYKEHRLQAGETPFRRQVTVQVTTRVPDESGRTATRRVSITFDALTAQEFFTGGPGQPDTCKGDSGGPVFWRGSDGKPLLVGITSRGGVECGMGGVYGLVAAHLPWLRSIVGPQSL